MNKLYSYKGSLANMTVEEVAAALDACDKKLRTTAARYTEDQAFNAQIEEVKKVWPDKYKEALRNKARELAGQGGVTPAVIRKCFVAFADLLATDRAALTGRQKDSEHRYALAEASLATLFRKAPDVSSTTSQGVSYTEKGKFIRVKPSVAPRNLIVDNPEASAVNGAEIWILAMHVEDLSTSLLLGYATKEDVLKAKQDERKSYSVPLASLRPMSAFYAEHGIVEVPGGLSMESVPHIDAIPVPSRKELQNMGKGQSKDDFDFLASIGASPEPAKK